MRTHHHNAPASLCRCGSNGLNLINQVWPLSAVPRIDYGLAFVLPFGHAPENLLDVGGIGHEYKARLCGAPL